MPNPESAGKNETIPQWNARPAARGPQKGGGMRQPPAPGEKNLREQVEAGREHFAAGRYDEAMEAFEAILEENAEAAPAYVGIGNVHAKRGAYKEALEYYEGALHLQKDLVPALMMSGNIHLKQGSFDEALDMFKRALAANPGLDRARLNISVVYGKTGRVTEAMECLHEALKLNPQFEEARLAMAQIYENRGDVQAALDEIRGIICRDKTNLPARLQLARMLVAQENYSDAAETLKAAIGLNREVVRIYCLLGRCQMSAHESEKALASYSKAAELKPELMMAKIGMVRALMELNRLAETRPILVEMSKGGQGLGLVHRMLGDLCWREQKYDEAVAEYGAAILHSATLVEKHPELMAIEPIPGDSRKTAETYKAAFDKIGLAAAAEDAEEPRGALSPV